MKKVMRTIAIMLAVSVVLLCMSACGNETIEAPAEETEKDSITVVDMAGNSITFDEYPTSVFASRLCLSR